MRLKNCTMLERVSEVGFSQDELFISLQQWMKLLRA